MNTAVNHDLAKCQIVMGWDFTVLKQYMLQYGIYTEDKIERAELEYKRFLIMNLLNQTTELPVSNEVDPFWHSHILFTQDYTEMSMKVFGSYFHHRPAILDTQHRLDGLFEQNTRRIYRDTFGEESKEFWGLACCAGGCKAFFDQLAA